MNWWGDGEEERVGDEGGGVEVDCTRKNIFICFSFLQDFRSSPSLISFCRGGGGGEMEEGEREEEEEGRRRRRRRRGGGEGHVIAWHMYTNACMCMCYVLYM